jgi:hypothetical protein
LIQIFEVYEAQEMLGIHLAPKCNTGAQAEKMRKLATQWEYNMHTGKVYKESAWLAITSTILRTLS